MIWAVLLAAYALPPVPGAINSAVTQANISTTICKSGWTKTIRPPASYTDALKLKQMVQFGMTGDPHAFEEDHLVPLEAGGNPTDPANLWPQPWDGPYGAHRKDVLETKLKRLVCGGQITLADAQQAIRTDWVTAYQRFVGPLP